MSMSNIPSELKYSREHEWVRVEDKTAVIGISYHAQEQLGDIVYVELPEPGGRIEKEEPFGVVESTKAVSDIFAPISGKVLEANKALIDEPAPINNSPYEEGWLLKVELEDPKDLDDLMSSDDYEAFLNEES